MQTTRDERPVLHATDAEGSVQLVGREIGQSVVRYGLQRQAGMGVEETRQQRHDQRIGDARGHPEAQVAARRGLTREAPPTCKAARLPRLEGRLKGRRQQARPEQVRFRLPPLLQSISQPQIPFPSMAP